VSKRLFVLCVLLYLLAHGIAAAQWGVAANEITAGDEVCSQGFSTTLGVRKYINSFTSYEFPDPERRQLDPLSRLEWPWEQTFGVVRLTYGYPNIEFNAELAATLTVFSNLKAQDSDWTDPNNPGQKTVFSDAKAKPRSWMWDLSVNAALPRLNALRGLIGFRGQQFRFTYTDITQREIFDENTGYFPATRDFTPGEAIQFTQNYQHWYFGGVVSGRLGWIPVLSGRAGDVSLRIQADFGLVTGKNEDFHVLRTPGPRFTYEITKGNSWHVNVRAEQRLTSRILAGVEADFMRIRTRGRHKLTDPTVTQEWYGANVWSDQGFVGAYGSFFF
jgi:hypothetical protein